MNVEWISITPEIRQQCYDYLRQTYKHSSRPLVNWDAIKFLPGTAREKQILLFKVHHLGERWRARWRDNGDGAIIIDLC